MHQKRKNLCLLYFTFIFFTLIDFQAGKASLHDAVKNGEIEKVKELLGRKVDVNAQDESGSTPLYCAVEKDNVEMVKLLLAHNAKVSIQNDNGDTPLHRVAIHGETKIANLLLSRDAAIIDVQNKKGKTPLRMAIEYGEIVMTALLLKNKANVNAPDKSRRRPLDCAVDHSDVEIVRLLLKYKAEVNVQSGNGDTPLHTAARRGEVLIAELLLNTGATIINVPNNAGGTPLYDAVAYDDIEVAKLFFNNDVTRAYAEVSNRKPDMVKLLLKHGADVNREATGTFKRTPLHIALEKGREDIVNLLLQHKADVNKPDVDGNTPFHEAVKKGKTKMIKLFLCHSANVDKRAFDLIPAGNKEVRLLLENHRLHSPSEADKPEVVTQEKDKGDTEKPGLESQEKQKTPFASLLSKSHSDAQLTLKESQETRKVLAQSPPSTDPGQFIPVRVEENIPYDSANTLISPRILADTLARAATTPPSSSSQEETLLSTPTQTNPQPTPNPKKVAVNQKLPSSLPSTPEQHSNAQPQQDKPRLEVEENTPPSTTRTFTSPQGIIIGTLVLGAISLLLYKFFKKTRTFQEENKENNRDDKSLQTI